MLCCAVLCCAVLCSVCKRSLIMCVRFDRLILNKCTASDTRDKLSNCLPQCETAYPSKTLVHRQDTTPHTHNLLRSADNSRVHSMAYVLSCTFGHLLEMLAICRAGIALHNCFILLLFAQPRGFHALVMGIGRMLQPAWETMPCKLQWQVALSHLYMLRRGCKTS